MKIETRRLILRQITMKDAKDVAENINNLKVSRYMLAVPYPYKLKDAKSFIKKHLKKIKKKPQEDYSFGILLKSEKKIIGAVGLHKVSISQGTADLGYWLGENYWRQGIMTEVASKVLDFAFDRLRLRKIKIPIFKENKASNALARKLGAKLEGTLRKHARSKATGKIHDENIYGLLKKEWKKARKRLR